MTTFKLPNLPYSFDALAPHISKETLEFHYGKHHQAYVTKLNLLLDGKKEANWTLEQLIVESQGPLFNNAAQIWNHTFYWNCLSPHGGGEPEGSLAAKLRKEFGSSERFKQLFTEAATNLFGSGWVWLAKTAEGNLEIIQGKDADNPLRSGKSPILTCDVWEHAYYIDYRNARPKYIDAFWSLVNWDFVESQLNSPSQLTSA